MYPPCPCLHTFHTKQRARSLHISVKNHDTQTEKGEFIYKALTLPGKQLLLKHDRLRFTKPQKCCIATSQLLSHS